MAGGSRRGRDRDAEVARSGLTGYTAVSSLSTVSETLKTDLEWEIKRLLRERQKTGGAVRVLDSGCGVEAMALRDIAKKFGNEIAEGRLELHGLHLTKPREWKAFLDKHRGTGVRLHNLSANALGSRLIRKRFDVIYDHFGALPHARNPEKTALALASRLAPGGFMAFHFPRERDPNPLNWRWARQPGSPKDPLPSLTLEHAGESYTDIEDGIHSNAYRLTRLLERKE